jgi:hypothetical protein
MFAIDAANAIQCNSGAIRRERMLIRRLYLCGRRKKGRTDAGAGGRRVSRCIHEPNRFAAGTRFFTETTQT